MQNIKSVQNIVEKVCKKLEKLNIYADGYKQLAIYALILGLILIIISPLVKKLMAEVK